MNSISQRDREVWRAALTLANNLCVQASDRHNSDDETDEARAAASCATSIRVYIDVSDDQLDEILCE